MALERIIMHWTAGGHTANSTDKRHYHEIVQGDGSRVRGDHLPEANISTADGHYAAHVRKFNTGSIGLSMAAMAGAKHSPFDAGDHPITKKQLAAFVKVVAEYADTYDIPITRQTVLSHSEVPLIHNKPQPGKWDINWIPGMKRPGNPIEVGDKLREMIRAAQDDIFESTVAAVDGVNAGAVNDLAAHILEFFESNRV